MPKKSNEVWNADEFTLGDVLMIVLRRDNLQICWFIFVFALSTLFFKCKFWQVVASESQVHFL